MSLTARSVRERRFVFAVAVGVLAATPLGLNHPILSALTLAAPVLPAPTVTDITPSQLPYGYSATAVTITGTNLQTGATIIIGDASCLRPAVVTGVCITLNNVVVVSATSITGTLPARRFAAGVPQSVSVTNPDHQSATLVNAIVVDKSPNGQLGSWQALTDPPQPPLPSPFTPTCTFAVSANQFIYCFAAPRSLYRSRLDSNSSDVSAEVDGDDDLF